MTNHQGIVTNTYDYTAFGESRPAYSHPTHGMDQRYSYTGREQSNLHQLSAPMYYRYRQYDPSIGRFTRRDPAGYPKNRFGNLYQYVDSNPISSIDPYGLDGFIYFLGVNSEGKPEVTWERINPDDGVPFDPPSQSYMEQVTEFLLDNDADFLEVYDFSHLVGENINNAMLMDGGRLVRTEPFWAVRLDGMYYVYEGSDSVVEADSLREASLGEYMLIHMEHYAAAQIYLREQSSFLSSLAVATESGVSQVNTIAIMSWFNETSAGRELINEYGLEVAIGAAALYTGYRISKRLGLGRRAMAKITNLLECASDRVRHGNSFTRGIEQQANRRIARRTPGRSSNKLTPDSNATGAHTTIRRDSRGNITGYEEWTPNQRNPTGFDSVKRVDTQFAKPTGHFNKVTEQNIIPPHVHEKCTPGGIRPARPNELPK